MAVEIMQVHVERLQTAQYRKPDSTRCHRADVHSFNIVGPHRAVCDVPAALSDPVMRRNVIAYQAENHHYNVLGNANRITKRHFGDSDLAVDRCLQINMVRTNAGSKG